MSKGHKQSGAEPAADTRVALLRAARECFARDGFERTTNRAIAEAAGMTTGIIYYYFESKQALFRAVMDEVSSLVIAQFRTAIAGEDRFDAQFEALLDAAARIHENDSSIAGFTVSSPIEIYRNPDLLGTEPIGDSSLQSFFHSFVSDAAERGEIPPNLDPTDVENMVVSLTLGLAYYSVLSDSPDVLRSAMRASGTLFALALATDGVDN